MIKWVDYAYQRWSTETKTNDQTSRPITRTTGEPQETPYGTGTIVPTKDNLEAKTAVTGESRTKISISGPLDPRDALGMGYLALREAGSTSQTITMVVDGKSENPSNKYFYNISRISISITTPYVFFTPYKLYIQNPRPVPAVTVEIKTQVKQSIKREKLKLLPFIKRKSKKP